MFVFLQLLSVMTISSHPYCEHFFWSLNCTRLSDELVQSGNVQRLYLPSGSGDVLIDARQATRLRTIDDGVGDIVFHVIVLTSTPSM